MILTAKNLTKIYNSGLHKTVVLDGLDFSFTNREIIGIHGASGSGKSTLLNILGLLDFADKGSLYIENRPILTLECLGANHSNIIGFLFQSHHLLTEFTAIENLMIPLMLDKNLSKDQKIDWCEKLFNDLNLLHIKDKYIDELSGGECQRIAFLRSIINKPKYVLADEPTGNLDAKNTEVLLKLINNFRESYGITFIIATHDNNISKICDRILELKNGKLYNIKG